MAVTTAPPLLATGVAAPSPRRSAVVCVVLGAAGLLAAQGSADPWTTPLSRYAVAAPVLFTVSFLLLAAAAPLVAVDRRRRAARIGPLAATALAVWPAGLVVAVLCPAAYRPGDSVTVGEVHAWAAAVAFVAVPVAACCLLRADGRRTWLTGGAVTGLVVFALAAAAPKLGLDLGPAAFPLTQRVALAADVGLLLVALTRGSAVRPAVGPAPHRRAFGRPDQAVATRRRTATDARPTSSRT